MMRILVFLAMTVGICAACSDRAGPADTTPAEPAWLLESQERVHPLAAETLMRFRRLVEGDGWRGAAWNVQGTLEAIHEKTGLVFVLIPGGNFLMGSPESETGRWCFEQQHRVTVPAFLLCKTECTQAAWVCGGGTNRSMFKGSNRPVENVRWNDCHSWCEKLGLRLPSEAEWEYACRAGTETPFSTGATLTTDQANYDGNHPYEGGRKGEYREQTVKVGSLPANPWGLHEMHGNAWEWCEDVFEDYSDETPRDGSAFADGGTDSRVLRGATWGNMASGCRSAGRYAGMPEWVISGVGFRPAASLPK